MRPLTLRLIHLVSLLYAVKVNVGNFLKFGSVNILEVSRRPFRSEAIFEKVLKSHLELILLSQGISLEDSMDSYLAFDRVILS